MRPKQATVLGICALTGACEPHGGQQTEGSVQQELIAGAPVTVDARLIEKSGGRWNLLCLGRFRLLGVADSNLYEGAVAFFEEGAQVSLVKGQVSSGTPTLTKSAPGNVLKITHPSADPAGSLMVEMVRSKVDPRRRHSCQVIVKRNGTEVLRSEARPPRQVLKPSGVFSDSGQVLGNHQTQAVALGDLDGDGDLDLFEGNRSPPPPFGAGQPNRVRRNDGSGRFTDTGQAVGNSVTFSVALGDLDGDGDLDLFEGNFYQPNRVFRNNGSGVFTDSGQLLGNHRTFSIALGDLDGDGDLDAVEGNYQGDSDRVWLNNGAGTFTGSAIANSPSDTVVVTLGDVDGDGHLDLVEGNYGQPNRIFLNDGDGNFTDTGQYLGYNNTTSLALGDLDGDGDLDLFEGNRNQASRVWTNNGSGVFTDSNQALGDHDTYSIALGDLDGDADLDAFEGNRGQSKRVFLNDGTGIFSTSFQLPGAHATTSVVLGDLNGDGDLDAVEGTYNQGSRVWTNQ